MEGEGKRATGRFAISRPVAYIGRSMESPSLNVLAIKKIAHRKGCTVERTVTLKSRPYVRIYDAKGRAVDGPGREGMALTLTAAKQLLEACRIGRRSCDTFGRIDA